MEKQMKNCYQKTSRCQTTGRKKKELSTVSNPKHFDIGIFVVPKSSSQRSIDEKIIKKKKSVPELNSIKSRQPFRSRSIIRGQVFAAPLPASRSTLFLTIPINSPSGKFAVMHEDLDRGSLKRFNFFKFQFQFLSSSTLELQMFVTHPNLFLYFSYFYLFFYFL